MSFDVKTYVVHCKKLIPRKKFLSYQFEREKFSNIEFYEDYDGIELTEDIVNQYYDKSLTAQRDKYKLWFPHEKTRYLEPSDISVTIKYINIYKKIVQGTEEYALILEDDSILCNNFSDLFHRNLNQTPKDYDIIFIASGCSMHAKNIISNKYAYKKDHPATRCVGATVIKKSTCLTLLKTIVPFHLCIDWELNYHLYLHNQNVYWWEPPLVDQGSESGLFKTSMR